MKNKKTNKRNLRRVTKAATHKRKSRERARNELLRAVEESNVGYDALHIGLSDDLGRRGRRSNKIRRDEQLATGVFSSSKSGFGFVKLDGEFASLSERDIFIPEDKVGSAISYDRVEVVFHTYNRYDGETRTEGRIIRILEEGRRYAVGVLSELSEPKRRGNRVKISRKVFYPDDRALPALFLVSDGNAEAEIGDKIEAELVRGGGGVTAKITRSFGRADTREASYEAILAECAIPVDFSEKELAEARRAAAEPICEEGRCRSGDVIFTMDGEGAKDLDDAVSLRKTSGGWLLGVHIADVSTYVTEKSALDRAVMERGTSVYFVDKVVPMLPPELSNGACSLNVGEDKYALSLMISLDGDGNIKKATVKPSIINSRLRGVYSEVNRILDGTADHKLKKKYECVKAPLLRMKELYLILERRSRERGAVELEGGEAEIILAPDGNPCDVVLRERGVAERIIEQFMVKANEACARLLSDKGIPCVYRVHDDPPTDKLSSFLTYLGSIGFDTRQLVKEGADPLLLSDILREADERGILRPVSYTMLRSMAKARYSAERSKHFGLALDYYCHFTSPIRRLSDLATHRIIHKVLLEGKRADQYSKYAYRAAAAATEAELRAISAERRIEDLYKCIYMSSFIGEDFVATVSSVTSFGFFVELDNTCEGLVPIEDLPHYSVFDEKRLAIRSGSVTYRLGDSVRVRLVEADRSRGKLRFTVIN